MRRHGHKPVAECEVNNMLRRFGKIEIDGKIQECKIVARYNDGTCRIEYPTYHNGRYNGYEACTVDIEKIIFE